jgi:hypothetical protein
MKPHRGTLILVLGILGLIVCMPLGIAAWVMGSADLKEMDAGTMDASGRSMTQAGKICGMIATILCVVAFIVGFMAALVVGFAHRH